MFHAFRLSRLRTPRATVTAGIMLTAFYLALGLTITLLAEA